MIAAGENGALQVAYTGLEQDAAAVAARMALKAAEDVKGIVLAFHEVCVVVVFCCCLSSIHRASL